MPFFAYPSFSKALHRPKGVRIGEFEAKRRKYVNFLDFDFLKKYYYIIGTIFQATSDDEI